MNCLVLANGDLKNHVTDEGEQLQAGLEAVGWTLAGFGYGDGCVDVPTLLKRHQPRIVLISAREDWDASSPGCFDKRCSFNRISALASHRDIFKVSVVKDCPGVYDRRRGWCEEIKTDAALLYYHPESMLAVSPWLAQYRLMRTWHTIDAERCCELLQSEEPRKNCVVSGANHPAVYPLRSLVVRKAHKIGFDVLTHPGYEIRRCDSARYQSELAKYKVHLATASIYGFSLRKIIETVAVGTVPITNLPAYDELPEIDGALHRVDSNIATSSLKLIAQDLAERWNSPERLEWARRCWDFYDWRVRTKALSDGLLQTAR